MRAALLLSICAVLVGPALAGPPYLSDDPQPTPYRDYEIYLFAARERSRDAGSGAYGIDFNYGGAPDLQLTAVVPLAWERPGGQDGVHGVGNIELAAKYRFLKPAGEATGWYAAIFPRVFLASASDEVGDPHSSLLVPLWLQYEWGSGSTFGGGGCTFTHGAGSRDFCALSWAVTKDVLPDLSLGVEVQHQTPESDGAHASTVAGVGLTLDATEHLHLMAYGNRGLQHRDDTPRSAWYVALLFTF